VFGGVFIFGSEPAALVAHPLRGICPIDLGSYLKFLHYEYLAGPTGFHRGLAQLGPGEFVSGPMGRSKFEPYWQPHPTKPERLEAARASYG